jgi:uncharacterized protein YfaS (alpha-2-macroglobulin family)
MNLISLYFFVVLSFSSVFAAPPFDYDKAWREVDRLLADGLPKSAGEKVQEIRFQAIEDKNDPQWLKTAVYACRITANNEEGGLEKAILYMREERSKTTGAAAAIASTMLSSLYAQYFENKRYLISQRTPVSNNTSMDIATWSNSDFLRNIISLHHEALSDQKILQIPVTSYLPVLNVFDTTAIPIRPFMYEVVADRLMEQLQSLVGVEVQHSGSFALNDSLLFADDGAFVSMPMIHQDTASAHFQMIRIFQKLLERQMKGNQPDTQLDYDLKRLQYMYTHATLSDKRDRYIAALGSLARRNENNPGYTEVIAELASETRQNADQDSMATFRAYEMVSNALKKFPKSFGSARCKQLSAEISRPYLELHGEQVYTSKSPVIVDLDHKNVSAVVIDIIPLSQEEWPSPTRYRDDEAIKKMFESKKRLFSFSDSLIVNPYFILKRKELQLPSLPYGHYAVLLRDPGSETYQYLLITVSDLSYTSFRYKKGTLFIIKDRKSGFPVNGVRLTMLPADNRGRGNMAMFPEDAAAAPGKSYISGKDGRIIVPVAGRSVYRVSLKKGKDRFDADQWVYDFPDIENQAFRWTEFFTDRAIYRPGQTVFFKALLLEQDVNRVPSVIKEEKITVVLQDASYKEVSRMALTSNAFGSVHGSFILPEGRLNGQYMLSVQSASGISGQRSIQVEEYKRPVFSVSMTCPDSSQVLNSMITVKGIAKTYSGATVSNAAVTYRVIRNARYPNWYNWRMPTPREPYLIASSATQTDAEGNFTVAFKAISEAISLTEPSPYFTFTVEADVTDLRGETQSGKFDITLSEEPFGLFSNIKPEADRSQLSKLIIKAADSKDQEIKTAVTLRIYALKQPQHISVHKLYDGKSDNSEIFGKKKKYATIIQDQNKDFTSWPAEKIREIKIQSGETLDLYDLFNAGCYRLDMEAVGKDGRIVNRSEYVQVLDFRNSTFPKTKILFTETSQTSYQPGEMVRLQLGSPAGKIHANIALARNGVIFEEKSVWITSKTEFIIPVQESYRGGFTIMVSAIKNNRVLKEYKFIPVPWNNKKLKIAFTTFRDQTLPGSKEKYTIKISGEQKDKVSAEVVAAMYDASLDAFSTQYWRTDYYPGSSHYANVNTPGFSEISAVWYGQIPDSLYNIRERIIPSLISFYPYEMWDGMYDHSGRTPSVAYKRSAIEMSAASGAPEDVMDVPEADENANQEVKNQEKKLIADQQASPRKNLNETVFFYPDLKTDGEGNLLLEFTMNEALTTWRLMLFAHTADFSTGYDEKMVITKKDLMVIPGVPRFLREGDRIQINASIVNSGAESMEGQAMLRLFNAETMEDVTFKILQSTTEQGFSIPAKADQIVNWQLNVPEQQFSTLIWRITATSGQITDGEQNSLPVITNRAIITESLPVWTRGNETRSYTFSALEGLHKQGRTQERLILEYTAHPIWYAIQALPYIHVSGAQTSLQLSERLYINAIAGKITQDFPRIKEVFNVWKTSNQDALESPLSRNMALKSAQLEETPWLVDALSETEQRRQIAYLFDENRIENEKKMTIEKLRQRQLSNGGFAWLAGGRENVFITQQIMENLAFMIESGAVDIHAVEIQNMVRAGLNYMDDKCRERYDRLMASLKKYGGDPDENHLDALTVQYLYIKGRFSHIQSSEKAKEAIAYYRSQVQKHWMRQPLYLQAMAGLYMHRSGDAETSGKILKSILERSKSSPEIGMYWLEGSGYNWYQLPLERHVLIMQFLEDTGSKKAFDEARIWLMKQKQTNHWKTTKSTIAAIQALLSKSVWNTAADDLANKGMPEIYLGSRKLELGGAGIEAGSGYVRQEIPAGEWTKDMSRITIKGSGAPVSWGAMYYQFAEPLQEVRASAENPLKLQKKVFLEINTESGKLLQEVQPQTGFAPGDKIVVIIDVETDREMDYVLLRDIHISGFEPTEVLSGYRYEGGLLSYAEHKDLSTQLWFDQLPKGRHQITMTFRAVHKGSFSGALTTIENMYAPEFRSHSEGYRMVVR